MKEQYAPYGIGDPKGKDWFIIDHAQKSLVPGRENIFKTKREAQIKVDELNKEVTK